MLANTGAARSTVPHSQALRAACDNCRAQKLRCVIDKNDPMRCVRCKSAGRVCYHSPQGRSGRPSTRGHARTQSGPQERTGASSLDSTIPFQPLQDAHLTTDPEHGIVNTGSSVGAVDDFLAFYPSQHAYDPDPLPYDFTPDHLDDFIPSGATSASNHTHSFGVLEEASHRLESMQQGNIDINALSWDSPAVSASCPSVNQKSSGHVGSQSTSPDIIDEQMAELASDTSPVTDNTHALHLCNLSAILYAEHGRNEHGPWSNIEQSASRVLSSTKLFIKTLDSLKQVISNDDLPTSVAAQESNRSAQTHTFPSPSSICVESPSTTPGNPPSLTTPTILHLLSCYLRLMTLHAQLYNSIRSQLVQCKRSPDPAARAAIPSLFPNFSLGSVSLDSYAVHQYRFFLQVCLHDLGRVEALLGLPRWIRLRACRAVETDPEPDAEAEAEDRPEGRHVAQSDARGCGRPRRDSSHGVLDMGASRGQAGVNQLVKAVMQQAQDKGGCGEVLMQEIAALESQLRGLMLESLEQ